MSERTVASRMSSCTLNRIHALMIATTTASAGPPRATSARASSEAILIPRRSVPRGITAVYRIPGSAIPTIAPTKKIAHWSIATIRHQPRQRWSAVAVVSKTLPVWARRTSWPATAVGM